MEALLGKLRNILRPKSSKAVFSVVVLALIITRRLRPDWDFSDSIINFVSWLRTTLSFDSTTIILLIIAVLPWVNWLIRKFSPPYRWLRRVRGSAWLKILASVAAVILILAHMIRPDLQVDAITLGLIIAAILPWLTSLIESAKFPGGWEIKFRDVQAAGEKVTSGAPATTAGATLPTPSFLSVASQDPNLALVGLRIEIENRIRELASRYEISDQRSLGRMIFGLSKRGIFKKELMNGLQELVMAGNSAAHGASVEPQVAQWAFDYGPEILAALDETLGEAQQTHSPDPPEVSFE